MAQSLIFSQPPVHGGEHDPDAVKFNQRLVDKLKYCKEVLVSIRMASATGSAVPEESEAMGAGLAVAPSGSKVPLR